MVNSQGSLHGCERCKSDKSGLKQIGESIRRDYGVGVEDETVYECSECAAKWSFIVERGASRGKFWNPKA